MLGGLTIRGPIANFLQYICAKHYENWLRAAQSYCNERGCSSFWLTLYRVVHKS